MLATYPQFTEDYVLDELDGAKGWLMYNWAINHHAAAAGVEMVIVGKGYIQQEKLRIEQTHGQ